MKLTTRPAALASLAGALALSLGVLVGTAAGPSPAQAQWLPPPVPASRAGAKIGYVDLQRTLNETKAGKAAKNRLENEKKKKQKELDQKQTTLRQQAEELEKQRPMLKPDVARQRQRELEQKFVELQQTFVQFQQDLTKREAQLTREIFQQASAIIESIAKRDGYTMMLEKNESAVLWADPSTDITAEVNRRLDAGEGKTRKKK